MRGNIVASKGSEDPQEKKKKGVKSCEIQDMS